jgi:hypothetical protein
MKQRHDELVKEMERRNMNHESSYSQPNIKYLPINQIIAKVDLEISYRELTRRCLYCGERIGKHILEEYYRYRKEMQ